METKGKKTDINHAGDAVSVVDPGLKHEAPELEGLRERFTYFGLSGPIQNYIRSAINAKLEEEHQLKGYSNPYDPSYEKPGALGRGQAVATALGNFFKFWAYASTVIGAIIADQYLGKFKAILCACVIYVIGLIILVSTSTHDAIMNGVGLGGLIAAMVTIGLGTGGIKANVTPLCAEQYQNSQPILKTLKSGEQVIVDPELTVQRLFMWFYWVVNIGALSPLITVNVEAHHSFWLAYLIPLIAIILSAAVFILGKNKYVRVPPISSAILDACRTTSVAMREKGFVNAKPSVLREHGRDGRYPIASQERYTDEYVKDVQRGLRSCKMFLFFPFYFICWNQMWNNLISQAGTMALHGTPNDLLQNLNPIALCFFIPFLDCNVLQHYIYKSPPNSLHVWIQAPAYVLVALSEAFVIITGLELAFTHAPKHLRSVISALFWLTIAVAAAICIALSAVSQDPYLVWMYAAVGVSGFLAGCGFLICFFPGRKRVISQDEVVIEGHPVTK
ncbi:putative peptide transporter ptr2 [Paramyrothecium foliicola]|nr:putative peptide transporter ptr2 [Paramyrothecium foliicola]